jgi:hypothetical protein
MKTPEHVTEYIASMKELIKRYQMALKSGVSKATIEFDNNWQCLLCHPIGLEDLRDDVQREQKIYQENYNSHYEMFNALCTAQACPWIVITGKTCDEWYKDRNNGVAVYQTRDEEVIRLRIRQLRRWIKIYEKYL